MKKWRSLKIDPYKRKQQSSLDDFIKIQEEEWNKIIKDNTKSTAEKIKEQQQKERKRINKMIKSQHSDVKADEYLKKWDENADDYSKYFLNQLVENLSIYDGAVKANNIANVILNLKDASVDLKELQKILVKKVRIETAIKMMEDVKLPAKQKANMIDRIVGGEFQLKDGHPVGNNKDSKKLDNAIEKLITNEAANYENT